MEIRNGSASHISSCFLEAYYQKPMICSFFLFFLNRANVCRLFYLKQSIYLSWNHLNSPLKYTEAYIVYTLYASTPVVMQQFTVQFLIVTLFRNDFSKSFPPIFFVFMGQSNEYSLQLSAEPIQNKQTMSINGRASTAI